jgi:hypothetical protein
VQNPSVLGEEEFNVLETAPPDDINFFGHLPYDVLSGIGMNGAYWYARTSFDF